MHYLLPVTCIIHYLTFIIITERSDGRATVVMASFQSLPFDQHAGSGSKRSDSPIWISSTSRQEEQVKVKADNNDENNDNNNK